MIFNYLFQAVYAAGVAKRYLAQNARVLLSISGLGLLSQVPNRFKKKAQKHDVTFGAALAALGVAIMYNIMIPLPTLSGYTAYAPVVTESDAFADPNAQLPSIEPAEWEVKRSYYSQVTVYNSVPEQTQGDPFVTASGERVRDGILAANCLPFGTKVRMPDMYGDKVFVVKDRLAADKSCFILDIWQEWTPDAKSFGAPTTRIEIIERG